MQFPEDENAAEAMGCGDDRIFFLNDDYSIEELMSIIGNMDVLLGMRLHALIFSALMHVPFLGISYDPKIDNFLALIGQKASTSVQHMDGEKLYNDTCRILSSGLDEKDWEKVDALRERACENVQILKVLLLIRRKTHESSFY